MKTILALAAAVAVFGSQLPDADTVRDRLDKYLVDYEPQLSTLVADERMTQRDGASRLANRDIAEPTKNRQMVAEVAFIALPGDAGWLGFRRVVQVNGKTVSDAGPPLATLLTDGANDDFPRSWTTHPAAILGRWRDGWGASAALINGRP